MELIGVVVILVAAYVGLPLALRWLLKGRRDATIPPSSPPDGS